MSEEAERRVKLVTPETMASMIEQLNVAIGDFELARKTLGKRKHAGVSVDGTVMVHKRIDRVVKFAAACKAAATTVGSGAHR